MKSEPLTPTRAPDNQFRQMSYELNYIRNANLLIFGGWGWGRGFLFHRGGPLTLRNSNLLKQELDQGPGQANYAGPYVCRETDSTRAKNAGPFCLPRKLIQH